MTANNTATLPEFALETVSLSKIYQGSRRFPPKKALDNVSLQVPRGSFFALLGPNGAGKSTFINIFAGLVTRTDGQARVWDFDIEDQMRQARRAIGVVPQELNIDPFFTPRELLDLHAGLYGVPENRRRTDEILEAVGLKDKANAYARALSGGMRRRLLVAKAMVHNPKVLILDEPTAGVDIELRHQLWDYVKKLNAEGTTVLLTTHYLEEAQELCDKIAIINHGKLIACEDTPTLLRRLDCKEMAVSLASDLPNIPESLAPYHPSQQSPREITFHYPPSRVTSGQILASLQQEGLEIVDITTKEAELEDIFLSLTSGSHDQENATG